MAINFHVNIKYYTEIYNLSCKIRPKFISLVIILCFLQRIFPSRKAAKDAQSTQRLITSSRSLRKNLATLAVPYLPSSVPDRLRLSGLRAIALSFGLPTSDFRLSRLYVLLWLKARDARLEFFSAKKLLSKSKNILIL